MRHKLRSALLTTDRAKGDKGSIIVLFSVGMFAVLIVMGLVIDIGRLAANARSNQGIADMAALAAGPDLGQGDYVGACKAAINYLDTNAPDMAAIDASAFCAQAGNSIGATTCSGGSLDQAQPSVTTGKYVVSVHFPVPASEIKDSKFGAGLGDGTQCLRMRVIVSTTEPTFFAKMAGVEQITAQRSATIKSAIDRPGLIPALWVLDPTGCTALGLSGNNTRAIVGTDDEPGIVQVESNGTTCSQNQHTVSSTGSGALLQALPTTGNPPGQIGLHALSSGAITCSGTACDPADVQGGRLSPQPTSTITRGRAPIDWRWNCKVSYPTYHGQTVQGCPDAAVRSPYVDRLRSAIGTSGSPGVSYQRWTTTGHSCNASGTITVSGNWWIDCPNDLSIGNGTTVTFTNGNIVMDGGVAMTGGTLQFNTNNPSSALPNVCLPPQVATPCTADSSSNAAFIFSRSGSWNLTGGNIVLKRTTLFQEAGYLKMASANPPKWSGSTEGPFKGLSMWSELSSNKFQINGGTSVSLSGAFFTPEANPMSLSGGGDWGQLHAQFIAYHIMLSGGANLTMTPDPDGVSIPPTGGILIR